MYEDSVYFVVVSGLSDVLNVTTRFKQDTYTHHMQLYFKLDIGFNSDQGRI